MTKPGKPYLNNHLRFKILYHTEPNGYVGSRIVGFEVEAFSGAKLHDSWCCADTNWFALLSFLLTGVPDMPVQSITNQMATAETRTERRNSELALRKGLLR